MMPRRLAILGSLVAATIIIATPAVADELGDYLEEADQATYSGRRVVRTTWDGLERMGFVDVEQLAGMAMVSVGQSYMMVGDGKIHALGSPNAALSYVHDSPAPVDHDYRVAMGDTTTHLGRSAAVMEISESGVLRMRMLVDTDTSAPLETEVFDGEGNLFRYSTMVEFSPSAPAMDDYEDEGEYQMMVPLDEALVPAVAGRYGMIDVYGGPADGQQAFYGDGLFTFSLFAIDGRTDLDEVAANGRIWTVSGFDYVRVVAPAEVWVLWNAPGSTYALVGDLPPDHLEEVLIDLPRPGQPNWFSRVWARLFG